MAGGQLIDIVKRGKRPSESFDTSKLHASIVAACLSAKAPSGQAQAIAHKVTTVVQQWLSDRPEVTSHDIRLVASQHLEIHHPDAAYLYKTHRVIL